MHIESVSAETEDPIQLHAIADPETDNASVVIEPTEPEQSAYDTPVSIQPVRDGAQQRLEARRSARQAAREETPTEASHTTKRARLPKPGELGPISKTGIPSMKTRRERAVLPELHHAKDDALERHLAQSARLDELREAEDQALLDMLNSGYLGTIDADTTVTSTRNHPFDEGQSEEEKSWQLYANCLGVDPELFFPERGASTKEIKEICRSCVVREDCLEYALANTERFGIWGGISERERRRIRRQRALARAASTA